MHPSPQGLYSTVGVMCCLFSHLLVVLDDAELYEKGQPLPLHHIRTLVKGLKRPLFTFCWEHVSLALAKARALLYARTFPVREC